MSCDALPPPLASRIASSWTARSRIRWPSPRENEFESVSSQAALDCWTWIAPSWTACSRSRWPFPREMNSTLCRRSRALKASWFAPSWTARLGIAACSCGKMNRCLVVALLHSPRGSRRRVQRVTVSLVFPARNEFDPVSWRVLLFLSICAVFLMYLVRTR